MSKNKKESFFWTSYSDLMTSLFFVMLVLFILVIVLLNNKMKDNIKLIESNKELIARLDSTLKATQAQLDKIREIEASVENINKEYFEYDERFKRHTLRNINISFPTGESDIYYIPKKELDRLYEVGRVIQTFVKEAADKNDEVKYILLIEGQSSKDNWSRNNELSYERALALVNYWKYKGISLDNPHCEVIIAGSGQNSPFRLSPDISTNEANQRFVIHIIPKIGIVK